MISLALVFRIVITWKEYTARSHYEQFFLVLSIYEKRSWQVACGMVAPESFILAIFFPLFLPFGAIYTFFRIFTIFLFPLLRNLRPERGELRWRRSLKLLSSRASIFPLHICNKLRSYRTKKKRQKKEFTFANFISFCLHRFLKMKL